MFDLCPSPRITSDGSANAYAEASVQAQGELRLIERKLSRLQNSNRFLFYLRFHVDGYILTVFIIHIESSGGDFTHVY